MAGSVSARQRVYGPVRLLEINLGAVAHRAMWGYGVVPPSDTWGFKSLGTRPWARIRPPQQEHLPAGPAVAREVRRVLGPASGAVVQDIQHPAQGHAVRPDRARPVRPDPAGAGVRVPAGGRGVWPGAGAGTDGRRRRFAIAAALGARSRQLASFVQSEAIFVTIGGALLGAVRLGAVVHYHQDPHRGVRPAAAPVRPVGLSGRSGRRDLPAVVATVTSVIRARGLAADIMRDL